MYYVIGISHEITWPCVDAISHFITFSFGIDYYIVTSSLASTFPVAEVEGDYSLDRALNLRGQSAILSKP